MIDIVQEVARDAGVEYRQDVPVDESGSLMVDVYIASPTPLMVVAATSIQRLMEAEIIWLDAAHRREPAYVLATVESAQAVGISQYTRANYYTDKTVEFASPALRNLVSSRLQH